MRTASTRRVVFTVCAVGLTAVSLLAQDTAIRYRWTKGEKVKYRLTQDTNAAMSGIPGMGEMTVTTVMQQMQTVTPTDIAPDGAATLEVKYDAVKVDMGTPMGAVSYDSASPTPPSDPIGSQLAPVFGSIVGESVTMVLEPDGAVRSVTGATKIRDKMTQAMPNMAGMMSFGPSGGLEALFSDEAMKGAFGQAMSMLPKTAVKPGATWQTEMKVPGPAGHMAIAYAFTFKGLETIDGVNMARIAFTQKLRADGTAAAAAGQMSMKMESGTGDGEVLFDVKQGRMVKSTTTTSMPIAMTMTTPDGQTMSLQANTRVKTTLELVK